MKAQGTSLLVAATFMGAMLAPSASAFATEGQNTTVTGPYVHKNLAVYLLHGRETLPDDVKIQTLKEAMTAKTAVVSETGTVSSLQIQNRHTDEYIYVYPGDIVKGGKQDRTLPNGFLLEPKSQPMPVASFCVEQGRWAKRGDESLAAFSVSEKSLNSKGLKLASKFGKSQGAVWQNVAEEKSKLSRSLEKELIGGAGARLSPSSLQLALEDKDLKNSIDAYTKTIQAAAKNDLPPSTGMAFAINGKFNSADEFADRELFAKLWPKLLEAAATEAVAETVKDRETPAAPAAAAVSTALANVEAAQPAQEKVAGGNVLVRHEKPGYLTFDTQGKVKGSDVRIHRNVLAVTEQELAAFKQQQNVLRTIQVENLTPTQTADPEPQTQSQQQSDPPEVQEKSKANSRTEKPERRKSLRSRFGR